MSRPVSATTIPASCWRVAPSAARISRLPDAQDGHRFCQHIGAERGQQDGDDTESRPAQACRNVARSSDVQCARRSEHRQRRDRGVDLPDGVHRLAAGGVRVSRRAQYDCSNRGRRLLGEGEVRDERLEHTDVSDEVGHDADNLNPAVVQAVVETAS
jgi:hypothetical protein